MHPPLDRPHPMCQEEIKALRECHAKTSKLQFWVCNEAKFAVDKCFKLEKQQLLKKLNADYEEKRKLEDEALRDAIGRDQTFEEYLKTDKTYLREMEQAKKSSQTFSEKSFS